MRFLLKKYLIILLLSLNSYLLADSLGPTTLIENNGNPFGAPPYSCFNTQTNQFFVGWVSGSIYYSLYTPQGILIQGPTVVVSDSGPVIPFTLPGSCYNSTNNQFLISYLGQSDGIFAWFNILDQNGNSILGPVSLANPGGDEASSLVLCCYNSINNEYALTWGSAGGVCYFAIIDDEGNVITSPTQISGSSINAAGGLNVFVSYNDTTNQYFFTWQDASDDKPHFAIYNANGTVDTPSTLIPSGLCIIAPVLASSYNSTDNQYLITWNDLVNRGFFALYDAQGTPILTTTQQFTDNVSTFNFGSIVSSYNSQNNEYFLSWEGTDGNSYYAIYGAAGNQVVAPTVIPNLDGVTNFGFVTNSYSITANSFFIAWIGPITIQDGYYAIYTRTSPPINPPTNGTGLHILNRFANYGEYFNVLHWQPSSSPNIVTYRIYREGILIATVPSSQTTYEEHNQPNIPVVYSITAVNGSGVESTPLTIQV